MGPDDTIMINGTASPMQEVNPGEFIGHASNYEVAYMSLIRQQVHDLCRQRGVDPRLIVVEPIDGGVQVRTKEDRDKAILERLLDQKVTDYSGKIPVERPLNRKERRAIKRGR